MEAKGGIQWSSIIVPSVQEMVEENLISTVPPRYVRSDLDKAEIDSDLTTEIPIIDMNLLYSSTSMDSEIDKLDSACKEWGFFQASFKNSDIFFFIYYNIVPFKTGNSFGYKDGLNKSFMIISLAYKPWNRLKFLGQDQVRDSRLLQPSHDREEEPLATTR